MVSVGNITFVSDDSNSWGDADGKMWMWSNYNLSNAIMMVENIISFMSDILLPMYYCVV